MRQTAKLQYHYYHTSEFDFPLRSFSAIQGISRSFDLQSMLHLCPKTQPHTGVQSVFSARMADRFKQLNLSTRGPGRRGAAYRKLEQLTNN